jgi:hypothetical protein
MTNKPLTDGELWWLANNQKEDAGKAHDNTGDTYEHQ